MPRIYRLKPSPDDHPIVIRARAHLARLSPPAIPTTADLTKWFPGVRDQGDEGSCSGFSGAEWTEVRWGVVNKVQIPQRLSPAYVYARERMAMGTFPADSGGSIADTFGVLETFGVCPETGFPYDANPKEEPSKAADNLALSFRITQPCMVPITKDGILASLGSGRPVAFATPVHRSFEEDTDNRGNIPMPGIGEKDPILGYHALVAMGADQYGVYGPNHWGGSWGEQGWWRMTWDFVTSQWSEAWNAS